MMTDKDGCKCYGETVEPCPVHPTKKSLTEEEELGNMVVYKPSIQYRIIDTTYTKTLANTEIELNDLAAEGWRVVGVTDHWVYMEKISHNYLKG